MPLCCHATVAVRLEHLARHPSAIAMSVCSTAPASPAREQRVCRVSWILQLTAAIFFTLLKAVFQLPIGFVGHDVIRNMVDSGGVRHLLELKQ